VETGKQNSPLDEPLNATYVFVIVVEIAIVVLLYILGRMVS
jgi:hypothetical protein